MKINFILPLIGLSGGVKVVFEYANHLQNRGHDVTVYYPLIPLNYAMDKFDATTLPNKIMELASNIKNNNRVDWFDLKVKLARIPTLNERYISKADIIVATAWQTAYIVSKFSKSYGEKFYLIQGYETWNGSKDLVENSYDLGLHNIVISNWLKNILLRNRSNVDALIFNGINPNEFYPEEVPRPDRSIFRILMPYRKQQYKGVSDGLKAFDVIKNRKSNVKLVMYGPKPMKNELPSDVEFHIRPVRHDLRRIYNSCDIFMYPGIAEGFGLPPLEAMSCKIPVVTTNVGAIPDIVIPEKTALVSNPNDYRSLAENVIRLIEDDRMRETMANNGYTSVKQYTWDKSTLQLETLFNKYNKCQ